MPTTSADLAAMLDRGGIVALLGLVVWLFLKGEMVPRVISRQMIESDRAALITAEASTRAIDAFTEKQDRHFAELNTLLSQVSQSLNRLLEQDRSVQELQERMARIEDLVTTPDANTRREP